MHIILNTFGTSIQKENGLFVVYTPEGKQVLHPDKIKSISISRGAKISSDAALLAIEHEIDVLFVDKQGTPAGRIWSVKYGSISTIRRKQIDFSVSPHAVEWIKELIIKKLDNQIALLITLIEDDNEPHINKAINRIETYKQKIRQAKAELINDIAPSLRGWEGAASKAYFAAISDTLPQKMRFNGRSHPARDIFNMMLNYGYGMLYAKVESALIKAGLDPYVGVMHRDDYNRPVLAFDVIEIFRVWIDFVAVALAKQEVIDEDCYSIQNDTFWLETQGKRIVIQSVNDYMEEVVNIDGIDRTRAGHIDIYAQKLAQKLLKIKL